MKKIALPRVKGIRGAGRVKRLPVFKAPAPAKMRSPASELTPRMRRAYYALCGDSGERMRIVNKFQSLLVEYTAMTLPEAIMWVLLEDREISFSYQSALMGGRSELGGLVTDFMLRMGGYVLAALVNGDYWHTLPPQVMRDMETKELVVGQMFEGVLITQCLEVWESTLLSCSRNHAVDQLLVGIEVGRTG